MANPIIDDTTPNIVPGDRSTSETLATQGNVKNTLRVFWNRLRASLVKVITRGDTVNNVGSEYVPVYVTADGQVQACNAGMITGVEIDTSGNISNNAIPTTHTGAIVYLIIGNNRNGTNNENLLKIQSQEVKYPSGVKVKAKEVSNGDGLVVTYANNGTNSYWILLNKINTVSVTGTYNNDTAEPSQGQVAGFPGLMSAYDKAKLDSIAWGAKRNFNWLNIWGLDEGAATSDKRGVVKLGNDTKISISAANKVYPVQVNTDGQMGVSVPWQDNTDTHYEASIIAGKVGSTTNAASTENEDTYIHILDKNDTTVVKNTKIKIEGSGSVKISSDDSGNIIIRGEQYRVQKPVVTVGTITRNINNGRLTGELTFKDLTGSDVSVKVIYGGTARGSESNTFNLNQLQVTAPTANNGITPYYIPFFPIGRNDIMPGLIKLRVKCTVSGDSANPTYSYTKESLEIL